mmetsp:Transcript_121325/g.377199  ORF Transcript_121325/g.377199 Transcript_121325/m.377199 type:complete len:218 (+) Transcript_121325:2-655(+)
MAGWFDAIFEGSNAHVCLSTAPWCPGTHWYQIRFLLETPLAVNAGQHIEGTLKMEANNLQSYYVQLVMRIQGTDICSEAPCIDLKDPEYRFYTSSNAYCPPGTAGVWGQQGAQQQTAEAQAAPQAQPPLAQLGQQNAQAQQANGFPQPRSPLVQAMNACQLQAASGYGEHAAAAAGQAPSTSDGSRKTSQGGWSQTPQRGSTRHRKKVRSPQSLARM